MDKELFLSLYHQGYSDSQIAKDYNYERHTIHNIRNSLNLPRASATTLYGDEVKLLNEQGFSDLYISNKLNLSNGTISYIRRKLKIKCNFEQKTYKTKMDRIKGYMIRNLKFSAKRRNLDFDLKYDDIYLPKYCPLLNIELLYQCKEINHRSSATVDRIDNSKGYIKGNVMVISRLANAMKNEASFEELEIFSKNIITLTDYYKNQGALGSITDVFFNNEELNLDS